MNNSVNFLAIDFETATSQQSSICEVGVCAVRNGSITETRSWLVQPEDNYYFYWNTRVHGIGPADTQNSPSFPIVWEEVERLYLNEFSVLVAHNVAFDRTCLHKAAERHHLHLPELTWQCSLQTARRIYTFPSNSLSNLCTALNIPHGIHHRAGDDAEMCARLYLRELYDMGVEGLEF